MELSHQFTVPTGVEETWAHFNDIASVAECFPGATVTAADGRHVPGLGARSSSARSRCVYNGTGTFVEKDEAAHRFVVDAKGKDKRGNGTAGANVTVDDDRRRTARPTSRCVTDLAITGKPAQFGRGVMQDVSDKLLGQFVACLEQRLAAPSPSRRRGGRDRRRPLAVTTYRTAAPGGTPVRRRGRDPAGAPAPAHRERSVGAARRPPGPARRRPDEALDLGTTVLPVLLKSYWKQAAGGTLVLLVLKKLLSRSRS